MKNKKKIQVFFNTTTIEAIYYDKSIHKEQTHIVNDKTTT